MTHHLLKLAIPFPKKRSLKHNDICRTGVIALNAALRVRHATDE